MAESKGFFGRMFRGGDKPPEAAETPGTEPTPEPPVPPAPPRQSWLQRLRSGLARSSSALSQSITGVFTKRKLDAETLEELEDILIQADLGVETAAAITDALRAGRFDKEITEEEIKAVLAAEVEKALTPVARPLDDRSRPQAACHPRGRRQRHRQDHDHRQARRQAARRGQVGGARRRRHLPRRRHRAAQDLGRAHRRGGRRPRNRRRRRRPRLRCA